MDKIKMRQLKSGQTIDIPASFWEMMDNLPKFKKIGRYTQLTSH